MMALEGMNAEAEKIYRSTIKYFERPVKTSTQYKFELLKFNNPGNFVVKLKDEITEEFEGRLNAYVADMVEELNGTEEKGSFTVDPGLMYIGMPVLLNLRPEDEKLNASNLVRGEVKSVVGSDIELQLVDQGDFMMSKQDKLIPITADTLRIPKLAYLCCLSQLTPVHGAKEWLEGDQYIKHFEGENQLISFVDYYPESGRHYDVYVEVDKIAMSIKLVQNGLADPVKIVDFIGSPTDFKTPDYGAWVGLKIQVYGVNVFRDDKYQGRIKCTLQMESEVLNDLNEQIETYCKETTTVDKSFDKKMDTLCLALFDGQYYRGIIKGMNNIKGITEYKVYFVDYNDYNDVTADELLPLPEIFKEHPVGAVECQLTNFVYCGADVDIGKLKDMITSKDLFVVVDVCDPHRIGTDLLVSLFVPTEHMGVFIGTDTPFTDYFKDTIIEKKHLPFVKYLLQNIDESSPRLESIFLPFPRLSVGKQYHGATITSTKSGSISIQFKNTEKATRISKELEFFYEDNDQLVEEQKPGDLKTGQLAVGAITVDGNRTWYRVKIRQIQDHEVLVDLIDFGCEKSVSIEELYPIHSYYAKDHVDVIEAEVKEDASYN